MIKRYLALLLKRGGGISYSIERIMSYEKKGYISVFIAVVLWSLSGFIVKTVDASAIWISLIRSAGGFIFLSGFIRSKPIRPKKYVILAAIAMALFLLTLTITTQISTSAMAISLQYTAPMYLIAYNFIKDKKIEKKNLLVFAFIFIGVIINILGIFRDKNYLAIFTGLAIGLSFVFYSQFLQKVEDGNPLGIVSIINLICCGLYSLALPFNFGSPPTKISDLILIILAGILISGLSYALYSWGLRRVKLEKAVIIGLAEPILNPIWVLFFNGEVPPKNVILGMTFILGGALVDIFLSKDKEEVKEIQA